MSPILRASNFSRELLCLHCSGRLCLTNVVHHTGSRLQLDCNESCCACHVHRVEKQKRALANSVDIAAVPFEERLSFIEGLASHGPIFPGGPMAALGPNSVDDISCTVCGAGMPPLAVNLYDQDEGDDAWSEEQLAEYERSFIPEMHHIGGTPFLAQVFDGCDDEEPWTTERLDQYEQSSIPVASAHAVCLSLTQPQTFAAGAVVFHPLLQHLPTCFGSKASSASDTVEDAATAGGGSCGLVSTEDLSNQFASSDHGDHDVECADTHHSAHDDTQCTVSHTELSSSRMVKGIDSPVGVLASVRLPNVAFSSMRFGLFVCLCLIMMSSVGAEASDPPKAQSTIHEGDNTPSAARLGGMGKVTVLLFVLSWTAVASVACHMFANHGHALRAPPAWGPEGESSYPFQQWTRDVMLWSIASDMEPARKAASVMLVLRGAAKEMTRQIPAQAVVDGGIVNGVAVDPLTYLMHALQERFGNLGEEIRVQAITELMSFSRKGHEPIDSLLVRFDSIRARAAEQGGAVVSVQGVTWILLRAIGITDQQLLQLLAPFNGLFPATEAEFSELKTLLRRMGHILERTPGNIREGLRMPGTHAQTAFLTQEEQWSGSTQEHAQWQEWPQWPPEQQAFAASASSSAYATAEANTGTGFEDEDMATDSDTSSGSVSSVNIADHDPSHIAQDLFWAYRTAKHKWRKFMQKSTRTVRRFVKRYNRKGKGKGSKGKGKHGHPTYAVGKGKGQKGKHPITALLADVSDMEVQLALPAFRGQRTPGKGKGRKGTPKGPDGTVMRCYECGSTEHLAGACPRRHGGGGAPSTTFFARSSAPMASTDVGPLAGIITDTTELFRPPDRTEHVTFAMNTEDDSHQGRTYHMYMSNEAEAEDPLVQNDPWSSNSSQSWSLPTTAPRSFGPTRSSASNRGLFGFPFGMGFRRPAVSEPAQPVAAGSPIGPILAPSS